MGLEGSTWAVVAQSAVLKLENERQQLNPQRTGRVGWEEGACRTHCVERLPFHAKAAVSAIGVNNTRVPAVRNENRGVDH